MDDILKELEGINPELERLAEGHVELAEVDRKRGRVRIRLIGGRLC